MSPASTYNVAFRLTHILRTHIKKFTDDGNVIVYPSSWYVNHFELTLRDKDCSNCEHNINYLTLMEIIHKHTPDGWEIYDEETMNDYVEKHGADTPFYLTFKFIGEKL